MGIVSNDDIADDCEPVSTAWVKEFSDEKASHRSSYPGRLSTSSARSGGCSRHDRLPQVRRSAPIIFAVKSFQPGIFPAGRVASGGAGVRSAERAGGSTWVRGSAG